jgi:hypothetical protein
MADSDPRLQSIHLCLQGFGWFQGQSYTGIFTCLADYGVFSPLCDAASLCIVIEESKNKQEMIEQ